MWKWRRNRTNPPETPAEFPLKGAPGTARTKSYSAETGYVYQYVYRGYRKIVGMPSGTDYVFSVSRDRKNVFPITVRLLDSAVAECAIKSGREILTVEQYALAKMTLFSGFDRVEDMEEWQRPLIPSGDEMTEQLRTLGRI